MLAKLGPKKKDNFLGLKLSVWQKKYFIVVKIGKSGVTKSPIVSKISILRKKTLQNYEFEFLWLRCCDFYYFLNCHQNCQNSSIFRFFVDSEITAFGAKIQIIQNPWLLKIPKYQVSNCWTEFVIF